MIQAVSFGELLVDMVSGTDASLAEAPSFLKAPGGAPANVAVGLQKLGVPSRFVSQVGNDPFGNWLRDTVAAEGVDVEYVLRSEVARTTIAFVATRSDGKKDICFYRNPGADALLPVEAIVPEIFDGVRLLHVGSVSLSLDPCRSAQFEAVKQAREKGVLISFDPNWRPSLWDDFGLAHDLIWQTMPLSDIVKVADEEWEFVTGTTSFEVGAEKILAAGPKLLVTTKGPDGGAFVFRSNGRTGQGEVPGFKVNAIDTLGAGDAFVAGLLTRLLEFPELDNALTEENLLSALRFANGCGALATTVSGAIPSLPTRGEVEGFLADFGVLAS